MSNFIPPTFTPDFITAGDTVQWIISLPNYLPGSWTLSYVLVSASANPITITATDNGDGRFLISVPAATTTGWTAAFYQWQAYITNGSERHQVMRGRLTIKPNFAAQAGQFDPRSTIKITLDNLQAMIQGKATYDQKGYTINGRMLQRMDPQELIKWYEFYSDLYEKELQAERIQQGRSGPTKVLVRFNDPTAMPLNPQSWYKAQ